MRENRVAGSVRGDRVTDDPTARSVRDLEIKIKKFILVLTLLLPFPALANSISNDPSGYEDQEYQRQMEIYNQQAKEAEEQLIETDRQMKITAEQLKANEALLKRSEKQADRMERMMPFCTKCETYFSGEGSRCSNCKGRDSNPDHDPSIVYHDPEAACD